MKNIHILWPTGRPQVCMNTFNHWYTTAFDKTKIKLYVAVNTEDDKKQFPEDWNVIVTGNVVGVTWHATKLSQNLIKNNDIPDDDIVILCSDDMWSPVNWDVILAMEFKDYNGCIVFSDFNTLNPIVTLPIMTINTLKQLKGYIYHPAYCHSYSDNELFNNLTEMDLLKDIRKTRPHLIFEHRHHGSGKRPFDIIDHAFLQKTSSDEYIYNSRRVLSLEQRLT